MARKPQHFGIEGLPLRWAKLQLPEVYRGRGEWAPYDDVPRLLQWGQPVDADRAVHLVAAWDHLLKNPPTPYDAAGWLAAHE